MPQMQPPCTSEGEESIQNKWSRISGGFAVYQYTK
ncbi:hypothetical protein BofuT4_uP027770.1 [Botrytis cinerea T4]|uniref:Uncharacterized protein n=1 Tax=Botryotinia fuckeliana (strain T4) TaxID=999810 RepID=G2YA30_BOTF4|nr:hypothetical protein BofuT4_uP027770.1 [Botrytis cinerea T4]